MLDSYHPPDSGDVIEDMLEETFDTGDLPTDLFTQAKYEEGAIKQDLLFRAKKLIESETQMESAGRSALHGEILLELAHMEDEREEKNGLYTESLDDFMGAIKEHDETIEADQKLLGHVLTSDSEGRIELERLVHRAQVGVILTSDKHELEKNLLEIVDTGYGLLKPLVGSWETDNNRNLIEKRREDYFNFAEQLHLLGRELRRLAHKERFEFYELSKVVENISLDFLLENIEGHSSYSSTGAVREVLELLLDKNCYTYRNYLTLQEELHHTAAQLLDLSQDPDNATRYHLLHADSFVELCKANREVGMEDLARDYILIAVEELEQLEKDVDEGYEADLLISQALAYYELGRHVRNGARVEANIDCIERCLTYIQMPHISDDEGLHAQAFMAKALDRLARVLQKYKPKGRAKSRLRELFGIEKKQYSVDKLVDMCFEGACVFLGNTVENGLDTVDHYSRLGHVYKLKAKRAKRNWLKRVLKEGIHEDIRSHGDWDTLASELSHEFDIRNLPRKIEDTLNLIHPDNLNMHTQIDAVTNTVIRHLDRRKKLHFKTIMGLRIVSDLVPERVKSAIKGMYNKELKRSLENAQNSLQTASFKDPHHIGSLLLEKRTAEQFPNSPSVPYEHTLRDPQTLVNMMVRRLRRGDYTVAQRPTQNWSGEIVQPGLAKEQLFSKNADEAELKNMQVFREAGFDFVPDVEGHTPNLADPGHFFSMFEHYRRNIFGVTQANLREMNRRERKLREDPRYPKRDVFNSTTEYKRHVIDVNYRRAIQQIFEVNDFIFRHPNLFDVKKNRFFREPEDYISRSEVAFFGSQHVVSSNDTVINRLHDIYAEHIAPQLASQLRWGYKDNNPGNIGESAMKLGDYGSIKPITHYTEDIAILLFFVYPIMEECPRRSWGYKHLFTNKDLEGYLRSFHGSWNLFEVGRKVEWDQFFVDFTYGAVAKMTNLMGHENYKLRKTIPGMRHEARGRWHDECVYGSEWYRNTMVKWINYALRQDPFKDDKFESERAGLKLYKKELKTLRLVYPTRPECIDQAVAA
ncbi:MAG: hypothetical protein ACE5FT_03350 [Candidatus Nanoarchaeia archaeon]